MIQHIERSEADTVRAAWSASLCQNTMARFTNARETGMTAEQFNGIWSAREDISFGQNEGFWVGRNSVFNACVTASAAARAADAAMMNTKGPALQAVPGTGNMHRTNLMSPLVEVAGDCQTAKGMWYCPGVITNMEADGKNHLQWNIVRIAADFILEGGAWKIWHLFEGADFRFEMGKGYEPASGIGPHKDAEVIVPDPALADLPRGKDFVPAYDVPCGIYSVARGWSAYPPTPMPYSTFEETFTYGPEPFMSQGREG